MRIYRAPGIGGGGSGTPGAPGAAGASAYQVAVAAGYSGTEAQWLATLKGTSGSAGPVGPKGLSSFPTDVRPDFSDLPFGAAGQSCERRVATGASAITSGRLHLTPIWLNQGDQVETIGYHSAGTAMASGTNMWVAIYDGQLNALTQSVNQTTPTWAANTYKTFTVPTYTAKYSGVHYFGLSITATTMPSFVVNSIPSLVSQISPSLGGPSTTGLTATAPAVAAAPASGLALWACWYGRPAVDKWRKPNINTRMGMLRWNDLTSTQSDDAINAGFDEAMLEINWGTLQPNGPNTALDATAAQAAADKLNTLLDSGCKVVLGLGLHFEPSWLFSTYGDAVRFKNSAGVLINGDGGNAVFSQQMRVLYRDFFQRLQQYIPFGKLHGIRITSGGRPEVMYPQTLDDDTAASDYWCFDDAAMTGVGLAEGQVVNPAPLVVPSSNARPVAERRAFAEWYVDSLANVVTWQMDECDKLGFVGTFYITTPGVGSRPSQMESDITSTLPRSAVLAQGVAWFRIAAKLKTSYTRPATRIMIWCTDTAKFGQANYVAQPSDKRQQLVASNTTINSWSSPRYLKLVADTFGYKMGGENPGRAYVGANTADYDDPAGMAARVQEIINNPLAGSWHSFHWAHASSIYATGKETLLAGLKTITANSR